MRDLVFAMVWVVMFPVALWSAHIGVLLWIWVALDSPNDQLYGFMQGLPFNKLVAAVTVAMLFLSREKKFFYMDATIALVLMIAALATVSTFSSSLQTDLSSDLYQKLIKELVLLIFITGVMWSRHRIHMTVYAMCIALSFTNVVEGLEFIVSGGGHKILGNGVVGDNNSVALAALMMVPPLYYLMRYAELRVVRVIIGVVIALSLVTVVGTYSRGGLLGLLVLGAFLVMKSRNKFAAIMISGLVAVAIVLTASGDWFSRMDTISEAGDNASFMGRVIAWKLSTLIAMDHPLFGGGMHAVQQFPMWARYVPMLPSLDFITTPPPDDFPHAAHSIYFEVLGDLGFVGLALFLGVLGVAWLNCRWITRQTRGQPSLQWAGDLAPMLQVSLVVYMVSGALLSMAYFEGFWIFIGLISVLRHVVQAELRGVALQPAQVEAIRQKQLVPVAARSMSTGI